jgi:hypothetical protein
MSLLNNKRRLQVKQQQKIRKITLISTGFLIMAIAFLTGCAGPGKMSAFQVDEMLVRAGFQLHTADTPEKRHFLKSLPENRFLHKVRSGKTFYLYVNDPSCQCMYVGDKTDYLRFKKSVKENQLDERIDTTSSEIGQQTQSFPFSTNNPLNAEEHLP